MKGEDVQQPDSAYLAQNAETKTWVRQIENLALNVLRFRSRLTERAIRPCFEGLKTKKTNMKLAFGMLFIHT